MNKKRNQIKIEEGGMTMLKLRSRIRKYKIKTDNSYLFSIGLN